MYRLERVRLADGRPISLEIRHVAKSLGRKMTVSALEELAFIGILQDELDLQIGKIEGSVSAAAASGQEADLLNVSSGTPLVIRDYVFFDESGNAVSHGVSYYLSEIKFHYSIRR
jgi:GntR family transcriptional regulator